ncbi:MAG: universal stress protein [Bacteroidetes bacterium]|nr:universal stress protein [Bacteroidota bacterium]
MKFKKILVPTDFSDAAKYALEYAIELAGLYKGRLILIHVHEPMVYFSDAPMAMPDIVDVEQSIVASAENTLQKVYDDLIKNKETEHGLEPAELIIAQGKPFIEIIKTAKEKEADLIVMSTHGRSALEHMLLGSVTEKIVRKAPCPVLTVRAGGTFTMP